MKRAPITKQRSPWIEDHDGEIAGIEATWYQRAVNDGTLWAIVSDEPWGWHLSISFRDRRNQLTRYPTWDEIADARYRLVRDDIDMVMHLPSLDEYIAAHPTTFHLHQYPERPT